MIVGSDQMIFENIKVVDFSNDVAALACGTLLAERGAQVIHVEPPCGDISRTMPPFTSGGQSLMHAWLNRGKQSVVLDLCDPTGQALAQKLISSADIVLDSSTPGTMKQYGLDYSAGKATNPGLIYCSITTFGQTGPDAWKQSYEIVSQAVSGMADHIGNRDGRPLKTNFRIADYIGALNALGAISTALFWRSKSGIGQKIDISTARGMAIFSNALDPWRMKQTRDGNHDTTLCPYGIFTGPDGSGFATAAANTAVWKRMCSVIGRPDLAEHPDFQTNADRHAHLDQVIAAIEDWLASVPSLDEATRLLEEASVPSSKINTISDLDEDEHANACGWIRSVTLPNGGSVRCFCGTMDLSGSGLCIERAPKLGEHTKEVVATL